MEIAIVAVMSKVDEKWFQEWYKYHLNIGVTHFYMYVKTNNFGLIPKIDFVTKWENNDNGYFQVSAYKDAQDNFNTMRDWLIFLDLDEYIVPYPLDPTNNLQKVLAPMQTSLAVPVCTFTTDHILSPESCLRNNTNRLQKTHSLNWTAKHFYKCSTGKDALVWATKMSRSFFPLRVNHYPIRSLEDFIKKVQVGWPKNGPCPNLDEKAWWHKYNLVMQNNTSLVVDKEILTYVS